MMETIRKIIAWIVSALLSLYNNPLAKEMAMNILNTVANEFADVAEHVAARVKEASGMDQLTADEKYHYVVDNTKDVFKDVPSHIINQLLENALAVIRKNG
jgi:hypothetical protein